MPTIRDPVCGMEFPEEQAEELGASKTEFEGRTVWFCCPHCKATFEKSPGEYAPNLP